MTCKSSHAKRMVRAWGVCTGADLTSFNPWRLLRGGADWDDRLD